MMQNYNYRARTAQNQVVTGVVQATSMEAAKKVLVQNQLTPINLSIPKTFMDYLPFFGKVSLKDKSLFARQLATMIEAGLTLSQSMKLLIGQSKNGGLRNILESVNQDLQDGFSFSSSLAKYPEVFDTIYVSVVKAGEATGKLEVVLKQLADNLEKNVAVQSKIKGALFYPAFILCAMIGVAILMMTKVVPQLTAVFLDSGKELPMSTQMMIAMSNFMIEKWWLLILIILAVVMAVRIFLQSQTGVKFFSQFSVRLPVIGGIVEQSNMARFGRLLGMLLGSGVPMLEALRLVHASFTNKMYADSISVVAHKVERGVPMSVPISENPVFPPMVGQMVAVGEQTGKMDEVMIRLAEYYEEEVENKVAGLSSLIEPFVIILLGIGVAWLVISILLPVYQISTSV